MGQCAVVLAYLAAAAGYLTWRPSVFNPDAAAFSVAVYAAELLGFLGSLLFLFACWRPTRRDPGIPPAGMTVDVFVESVDEPTAMLRRTLTAARDMEYPHETWLLDDGNRLEAKALAQELGIRYLSHADGVPARARALRHGSAAFVALFDARHAPTRRFLSRTLGFFRDEAVAFVQVPRDLCSLEPFRRATAHGTRLMAHELSRLCRVVQPGRDHWNAAQFYGDCALLRREALDAVGGLPATAARGEDLRLSLRLHQRGYQSVHIAEPLAVGMAPQTLAQFAEARQNRARAAFATCCRDGMLLGRGLTLSQRLCYLATALEATEGWRKGFLYLVPVVALVTGVLPVAALDSTFVLYFAPYLLLDRWAVAEAGRGCGRTLLGEQFAMVRCAMSLALARHSGPARLSAPLWVLLGFGLAAIPAGLALDAWPASSRTGAFEVLVSWVLINSAFTAATLFTIRRSTPRPSGDPALAIPLPARIKFPVDEPIYGMVDHLSSTGFRFHGRFPEYARFGAKVSGELHLPGGTLPLRATIRSFYLGQSGRGERFAKSVGLSFDWVGAPRDHALDRMLCESELQGRIAELLECSATPITWLERFLRRREMQLSSRSEHWAPVLIHEPQAARGCPEVGMIAASTTGSSRTVLTFAPISAESRIHLSVLSRAARQPLDGVVAMRRVVDTPLAPMYAYRFIGDARARA